MRRRILLLALASVAVAGCDAVQSSAEESYRKSFVESCIPAASAAGTPAAVAEPICSCSADKVLDELGVVVEVPPPVADRILDECIAEVGAAKAG